MSNRSPCGTLPGGHPRHPGESEESEEQPLLQRPTSMDRNGKDVRISFLSHLVVLPHSPLVFPPGALERAHNPFRLQVRGGNHQAGFRRVASLLSAARCPPVAPPLLS